MAESARNRLWHLLNFGTRCLKNCVKTTRQWLEFAPNHRTQHPRACFRKAFVDPGDTLVKRWYLGFSAVWNVRWCVLDQEGDGNVSWHQRRIYRSLVLREQWPTEHRDRSRCHVCIILALCNSLGKVLPYSLPSDGFGAHPGVQAVSPQMTLSHPSGGRLP